MMTGDRSFTLAAAFAILLAAGCGGSGTGDGSPDGGGLPGGGSFTWMDAGTLHTAMFATGSRVTSASLDLVQISGGDESAAVSFDLTFMPPPLAAGTYACSDTGTGGAPTVTIDYTFDNASSLSPTCSITLTSIGTATGDHAKGTFSATVSFSDGSTRTITDGVYDVPITVSSL